MSAVRRAQPFRRDDEMVELFQAGRYSEAARLYDAYGLRPQASVRATILRANIDLRSDVPRAIARLSALRPPRVSSERATCETLLGLAYAMTGDYEAADARLESALEIAQAIGDADLIASAGYRMGQRYIMADAPADARRAWAIALQGTSLNSRLDALHLESFIYSREGKLRDQARVLLELLRSLDTSSPRQMEHRAWATHTLAILARELYLSEAVPEVERQLGGAAWPEDLRVNRFQTTKALGWAKALQGDYLNAFRYLKQSAELAPSEAWRAMAFCDRSYLARALGEVRWSRQELFEAEDAANRVDWDRCKGEEIVALLLLSELLAPVDAARASAFLARFRELGELKSAQLLYKKDERFAALADYSSAIVDIALGSPKLGANRLRRALGTYQKLEYEWRAARCALALFDATGDGEYLNIAGEKLRHYSSSWLADDLRNRSSAAPVKLSPMQERVYHYLCEGLSNVEIAGRIGRSEFTVANHAKAVLKAHGVSSRSALVALAMRRAGVRR